MRLLRQTNLCSQGARKSLNFPRLDSNCKEASYRVWSTSIVFPPPLALAKQPPKQGPCNAQTDSQVTHISGFVFCIQLTVHSSSKFMLSIPFTGQLLLSGQWFSKKRRDFAPWGHLATSGDVLGCHKCVFVCGGVGERSLVLASSGWRPEDAAECPAMPGPAPPARSH